MAALTFESLNKKYDDPWVLQRNLSEVIMTALRFESLNKKYNNNNVVE